MHSSGNFFILPFAKILISWIFHGLPNSENCPLIVTENSADCKLKSIAWLLQIKVNGVTRGGFCCFYKIVYKVIEEYWRHHPASVKLTNPLSSFAIHWFQTFESKQWRTLALQASKTVRFFLGPVTVLVAGRPLSPTILVLKLALSVFHIFSGLI